MDYFELKYAFLIRGNLEIARRELGKFLNRKCGIVRKKEGNSLWQFDEDDNCFKCVTIDDIIIQLCRIFEEDNFFSTEDVEIAVGFISERLTNMEMTEYSR